VLEGRPKSLTEARREVGDYGSKARLPGVIRDFGSEFHSDDVREVPVAELLRVASHRSTSCNQHRLREVLDKFDVNR
jgi:hypothetical protein